MTRSKFTHLDVTIEEVETPLGGMLLVADGSGALHAAEFADCEERLHRLLSKRLGTAVHRPVSGPVPEKSKTAFARYFGGDLAALSSLPLAFNGTPFQERVWTALRMIPAGATQTYSGLAMQLGLMNSARAVGHANGANPFSIVVPCHRLVGANGALTGYAGGIERKRWLLDHEARYATARLG